MKGPFHYEQLVRVPMLVRWPRGGVAAGMGTDAITSLVDLTPTCLAAAGLPVPSDLDGLDALPLWRGDVASVRDHALIECVDDPAPGKLQLKTVVTADHKLTWYAGRNDGELYDLRSDPREKVNRWDAPSYASVKAALLAAWRRNP